MISPKTAPAYTIQAFTESTDIAPKCDFDVAQPTRDRLNLLDGERHKTRSFKHNDPIAWTLAHRAEILRALYTILLEFAAIPVAPR